MVTVQFELRPDGQLRGDPHVTSPHDYGANPRMAEAVRDAVRAVRRCAPYPFADDPVTPPHYDMWREMEFTFAPPHQR